MRTNRILYLPGDNDVFVDGGPEHATRHDEGTYLGRDAGGVVRAGQQCDLGTAHITVGTVDHIILT